MNTLKSQLQQEQHLWEDQFILYVKMLVWDLYVGVVKNTQPTTMKNIAKCLPCYQIPTKISWLFYRMAYVVHTTQESVLNYREFLLTCTDGPVAIAELLEQVFVQMEKVTLLVKKQPTMEYVFWKPKK